MCHTLRSYCNCRGKIIDSRSVWIHQWVNGKEVIQLQDINNGVMTHLYYRLSIYRGHIKLDNAQRIKIAMVKCQPDCNHEWHPIARPWGWAMGCLACDLERRMTAIYRERTVLVCIMVDYLRLFCVCAQPIWETTLQYNVISHWLGACKNDYWDGINYIVNIYRTTKPFCKKHLFMYDMMG